MKFILNQLSSHLIHPVSSAGDNIEWINNLVAYIARVAQAKPSIKIIGRRVFWLSACPPDHTLR